MFTGLVEEVGTIVQLTSIPGGIELTISADTVLSDLAIGDSIAVDGVCLTVIRRTENAFTVQAVGETLEKTTFSQLRMGQKVNLERALQVGSRLGGHFVQGHVNATAPITRWQKRGENFYLEIEIPASLRKYVILEGSICIDGISLTVARLEGNRVGINIIPHTASVTNLSHKKVGDLVNVEVDLIAKYIESLITFSKDSSLTREKLKQWGY
ncbi:MAG: riboflavin synthase [Calditrichaeota bacterium]|nr:riboflavin synthase [Calditrichota bacterium]